MSALNELLTAHEPCAWEQIGPCVYCADHDVRLYQGRLPADRRPADCVEHDWDEEMGLGFYFICKRCGFKEWAE
jgi:hypothetical protein